MSDIGVSFAGAFPFEMAEFFGSQIDDEVIEDLRVLMGITPEEAESIEQSLASQDKFLSNKQLRDALKLVLDESKASAVFRLLRWFERFRRREGGLDRALERLGDLRTRSDGEPESKPVFSEHELEAIRNRVRRFFESAPGIERQAKAERLSEATGQRLKRLRLICDLRPVFDSKREQIEGVMPLTTLSVLCEGVTGFPVGFEAILSEKDVNDLVEMATMAKQKLAALRTLADDMRRPVPTTEMTRQPIKSSDDN